MTKFSFKLGADPEMFIADRMGQLKASCGRFGGSKAAPQPLGIGDGFAILEDNVAVEFNVPPADDADTFDQNIERAIAEIAKGAKEMYDFQIVNLSAAKFPEEELQSEAAQEFGCDPDFNAWTGKANPRPQATDSSLRSCGGHVHVGYDKMKANFKPPQLIKAMDMYLGVPAVLMDEGELRKQLYGKSGACRYKPYGVEYRTLSNFWIFKKELRQWVHRATAKALAAVEAQSIEFDYEEEAIRSAIDLNDKELARRICDAYELEVVGV